MGEKKELSNFWGWAPRLYILRGQRERKGVIQERLTRILGRVITITINPHRCKVTSIKPSLRVLIGGVRRHYVTQDSPVHLQTKK